MNQDPMNHSNDDGEDLAALYAATPRDKPAAAMDAAILAAARQSQRPAMTAWRAPLAMAATLVLGIAVTVLVLDEAPPTRDTMVLTQNTDSGAESALAKEMPERLAMAPATAEAPAPAAEGFVAPQAPATGLDEARARRSAPAAVAPARPAPSSRARVQQQAEAKSKAAAAPRPPVEREKAQPGLAPAQTSNDAAPTLAKKAEAPRKSVADREQGHSLTASGVAPPTEATRAEADARVATTAEAEMAATPDTAAPLAEAADGSAAGGLAPEVQISIPMDSLADLDEAVVPTGEQQKKLDEIQRLLDRRRITRARRQLRHFMQTWPDYPRKDLIRRFGEEFVDKAGG